jgi:hypothetical protein
VITAKSSSTATCVSCSEMGGVAFVVFVLAGVAVGVARVELASGDLDVRRDLVPEVGYLDDDDGRLSGVL